QFDHPQYVAAIISKHYDSPSDEDQLAAFNAQTERLGPEPFEVVPDIYARTMFNTGSVVVDGKLSSVLDLLSPKDTSNTSLVEVLSEQPHQLIIPYIRLILTTNFATSAKRLIQREKGKDFVGDPA